MGNISTYLQQIMDAVYGEQVRSAIHDAINQCYIDASAGITPTITVTAVDGGTRVDIAVGAEIISFVVQNGTATTQEVQYYVTEWLEENPDFYTTEVELLSDYIDDLATTGTYTKKNFYRCTSGNNNGTTITENSKQAYVVLTQEEATAHSIIYDNSVYSVEVIKVRDGSVISQSTFVTTSPIPYLDGTYDTAIINFKRQDTADLTAMERRLTLYYEFSVGGVALASDLDDKVDKVTGKGLSTEDYTTEEKTKLAGLTQVEVDDTLSVVGRAADAKAVGNEITSLKSVLYDRIIYVGKGNAYAEYTYDAGLKAGKTYRVFVNKWDTTGITVTTGYMFKLGYSDGGEITYKFEHYGNDSSVLKEYYDVTIPSDATDVLLAIGGRATGNAILTVEDAELYLEDAELYLNIENLQNTKVDQEDIIGLITGHIPTVQKLVKKFVTHSITFDVMSFSAEAGRRYRIDVTNIDALVGADIRIRVYNGTANVYNAPEITGDISANTKWTYYFNCLSTEVVTVQILRSGLTEDATFSVGVQCDDDRRDIDKLDSEVSQVSADVNMNVSRNLVGPDVEVLYPVAPLKTGDVITASAFNPSGVTTWCHVRFHALDGTQIAYFQFDTGYTSEGRTVTLNLNDSTAYFISISRDCGSPLMVERGTKTDLIPHYTTNYEKYLNSKSNFGEFEIFLPEQAEIIRNNFATARMAKRLCFGHTSDNHSTVYPFICNIIDLSDAKFIVNTGDIVQDKYSDAYTNFPNMINAMTKPHYITLGNHDVYKAPSKGDIFTKYFSPIISHNGQSNLDKTYYSVDFADEGVKCIFLDPYDALDDYSASMNVVIAGKMSETQINWLFAQLDDALTNAMHVCIFVHLSPEIVGEREKKFFDVNTTDSRMTTYSFITDVMDAFIDGASVTFNYSGSSYTHTFASAGVFVGYFCGHMHCDCIGKLKTHNRQNSFSVTRPWQSPEQNTIKDGTYRHGSSKWGYSTFNYVVVDPNTRHVSIMRVLQQDTKYGFKRDFVTVEY